MIHPPLLAAGFSNHAKEGRWILFPIRGGINVDDVEDDDYDEDENDEALIGEWTVHWRVIKWVTIFLSPHLRWKPRILPS